MWIGYLVLTICYACESGTTGLRPSTEANIHVGLTGLQLLDPVTDGSYEAWIIESNGDIRSVGRFDATGNSAAFDFATTIDDPTHFMVTIEPPTDDDSMPSRHKLLGGPFVSGSATLTVTGYVTIIGVPLETNPGVHVLATPTDDAQLGYPSREDAGLWLFDPALDTLDAGYYANLSPLTEGWWYEGWVVYDYGAAAETWISYGKFRPDGSRQANVRDDTGLGIFSGQRDYQFALGLTLHVPGDDWLSDSLQLDVIPFPLPLDLNGDAASGVSSRWTHVITIEPWGPNREAELPSQARPFFLQPYRNAIGEADPATPRSIEFHGGTLPSGTASLLPVNNR